MKTWIFSSGHYAVGFCLSILLSIPGCLDDRERSSARLDGDMESAVVADLIHHAQRGDPMAICVDSYSQLCKDDVPYATGYIYKHGDYSSFHLLMAIKEGHPEIYKRLPSELKAVVLVDMLKKTNYNNDWGILGPSDPVDELAAEALVETGPTAVPVLRLMLDDDSPAPLVGSQEATLSTAYHYRKCDYAYRYICLILKQDCRFEREVAKRDRLLERLKLQLKDNERAQ